MLDYRRMLMEDFSLSPEIVLHCRAEIETHCSGLHRKGRTLHCLMRIGRDRSTAIEGVCQSAVRTTAAVTELITPGSCSITREAAALGAVSLFMPVCSSATRCSPI